MKQHKRILKIGYLDENKSQDNISRKILDESREEKVVRKKIVSISDKNSDSKSSRAGIESERNTVDASVSDRAAARKAATKKNTQQKITQPGNSNELSGSSRSKDKIKINNTVNDEKKTVTTPAAGLPAINRADNIKEDAEISSIVNRAKGLSDEERKSFLVEEARKRSKSTSNADIVMKQLKRQDAGAWEQEKAEYNYRKENGLLEKNDAKTQHYIDRFYSMSEDERQLVANIYADIEVNHGHKDLKAKNKYTSAVNKLKFEYGYTDEDIEAMRYFYGRYINKKNAKTDDINARLAMDKHPVLESIASIPTGIAGGVMAAGGILDSYIDNKAVEKIGIQDQGIDYNHEFSKMQRQAQSGRDQFTKTHDFMIGGYDVGDLLYNTALSGVESATAAMIPGGAALLAVNAGTSKVNELSQRGLSSNKAIAGGLAAAATEMIFESVSIGNFKKMQEVEPNTIMDVVANVAKSMGVNASEEALTEAANIVYDTVMHGDKSDYQMQVEYLVNEKGMTREAAEKKARTGLLGQVGEAALSGAIMGVGFGGVASVPNYIGRSAAIEAMGIQAKKSGMKDEIIAEAKAAPKNSKANKTVNREIKKSEKSGEAISDYKLGLMAVQSNDVALKDTGRFSNVKTEAELEERYQSAMQMSKKAKATADSIEVKSDKQIQKEYERAKARIRMQAAAKAEADKFEGAQKTERKANELTRIEITNPTIEVDGKRYSIVGKNFDSKTEEIGDAQTIFKDADGDNAVRFGDGQTMKVSEAVEKMTDETAKEVYKATEGMSPEAANLFISNYDGDTVPEYKDAFNYYFNMGRAGLTAEDIRKDNELYGTYFTAEAQRQIATAGLKSREFKAGVTELTFSRSTKPYKQTVQLIDQWAKESGLEVIILKDSDKVNGYHLQGTNRIVLYTEVDGKENILTRTFGHETFHFISENSSAEAEKLRRYVIEALEKNGVDIEKALQKYADITDGEGNNVYSTRESQIDELVADSMFDVFTNKAAIERLAKNDRTLAQKIYDKFKDILNIIKSKLKLFDTMNNNPEIRALMNDADSLEQIVNKFHDALDVAKNNYNVHDSGKDAGKNFSFAAEISNDSIIDLTNDSVLTKKVNELHGSEKYNFLRDYIFEALGNQQIKMSDGKFAIVDRSDALHIANKAGNKKSAQIVKIKELVEKSSLYAEDNNVQHKKFNYFCYYKADVKFKNEVFSIYLNVGKGKNDKKYHIYDITEKIRDTANRINGLERPKPNEGYALKNDVSKDIISEDLKSVKRNLSESDAKYLEAIENGDTEKVQRIVDEAAKAAGYEYSRQNNKGKSATKKNFSISASTEKKGELVAVHNIYIDKMMDAFKLGGFPMPSIAVTKAKQGHDKYGPISVVFNKNTIDPAVSKDNKIYGGDAWTPTYPTIEYKVNEKVQDKISEVYYDVYEKYGGDEARPLYNFVYDLERQLNSKHGEAGLIESLMDDERLMQLYLLHSGKGKIEPVIKQTVTELSESDVEMYDYFVSSLGRDVVDEIKVPTGVKPLEHRRDYFNKHGEKIENVYRNMLKDKFNFNNDEIENVMENMKKFDLVNLVKKTYNYLQKGRTTVTDEIDSKATSKAIRNAINNSDYKQWINNLFKGVEEKSGIRNNADYFTSTGNRRSWDALHWENTLENVVKVMKSQNNGDVAFFSGHAIWGVAAKDYNSIEDMKKDSNRLKTMPEEDYNVIKEEFGARLTDIAKKIMDKRESNQFIAIDNAMECIVDSVRKRKTKSGLFKELKKYTQLEVTENDVDEIISLVTDISNMPTEYFEAKPERAVGFDEIEFVILPDNANSELIDKLNENGIEYKTYEAGNEKDRIAALNSRPDVLFSMNKSSAIDAHYGEVVKENKHWRAIVSMLTDEKFSSIRKDVYLNGSDIHRISKELIKKASSKYDLAKFENQLTAIFDYIATSKSHVDTDAVFSAIYQLSNDVLGESEIKDTELYEQYADVRKFLHDVEIYIPDNVRKEINSQFGDFKSFRNQLMGKVMHISTKNTNARSLDEVWQELSEIAPEYFPKDMNELDMPMQLTRFFDSIAPKIVNPYEHYEMNIEEEAAVFATEILESYYKIRVEKTDSGKARDIIKEGMRQLQINRKALQNDFKRKEQENANEYRERIAEYKFQRAEGDRRRRLRNEIERNYNYLNRRLVRETDKDRILKQFQPLVSAFRDIVPDSNSRFSRKALTEFENEYRKLEEVSTFYNEDFANIISDFKDRVTGIDAPRMRDIDGYELDVLRNITEHIKYIVQNENRLFSEGLNGRVEEFGKSVHNELFEKKDSKDQGVPERGAKKTDKIRNGVNSLIKGLTKPEYLFEGIGSPTVMALYDELRKGENIEAKIVYDAKLAEQEIKKRNNYDQRWETQTVTLDLRSGKRNVTIEDVMALYATSRRKQGLEHMLNGGVILYSKKELTKKNGKSSESIKRDTIKFTDEDIRILEKSLTNDQKNYVNDMVEYITKTIGEKRNEVSMKLYGIEKYKESFYFPIKVDRNFVDTSVGKQEVVSTIKNQSSSKRTVDHAKNPIEITGFTDTVNNHVLDSALYCAYVLPINDFKRVYNYREKVYDGDGVESLVPREISVKDDIRRTSGVNAIKEIERFMISVDSGSRYENLMPFSAKLMARTKKTAVMANLSVVVQQPTAVFRAMLYISPKHFATWANKADIEEMKRWNGCALKKEIGYFDVNMGRSATDYMNEYSTDKSIKEDWSLSDKVKNSNAMLKIDQAAGFLASKADEQTWGAIWKACKKQVKTENPGLSGDNLNAAAAELFQTTISKTQVYDSVFTKPEYMRRKEGFAMMATQFMSEPLTSLNMLAESVAKAKNTEKGSQQRKDALKFSARAFGCYITSVVVNSALKGIIYAMRDDDDDETFLEKYISNVAESIVTDPIGMVPYLKDILSIVQGYDLNRADVAVFTTMADAIKDLGSDKKTTFEKIMSVMKAAGQASGIPVYNVMRDAKSIIDIAIKIKEGVENGFPETTGRGVLNELKETFDWLPGIDAESNYEQLYSSIIKGDKKHYDRVYNSLVADEKSKSNIENGIGKVLAEKNSVLAEAFNLILADKSVEASEKIQELKNAGFSNEIINNALSTYKTNLKNDLVENEEESEDNRIKQAAFARYDMDYTLYESLVDELIADGYNETIVREAIDSEKVELEKAASEFSLNEKDEYTATYDMRNALQKNNFDNFESVYKKIAENSGESEAKKNAKSEIKKAYKDGHISEGKAGELLKEYVDSDYSDTDVWKELYKAKSSRNSIYDKMYDAIDNGGNFSIDYLLEQGIEKDDIAGQIATYAKPKLLEMEVDSKEYNEMYENILDAYVTVGKTEAYGASRIRKWHSDAAKAERKKNMRK